ncbi:MAG: penicillin-binding transpeptidase domain-containing protein [Clostridia bacterium]|nr:penicillin-binding transpeptidase domain-containing protein [Clostridia bacterium]
MKKAVCFFLILLLLLPSVITGCQMIRGNGSEFCLQFLEMIKSGSYDSAYAIISSSVKLADGETAPDGENRITSDEFEKKYTDIFSAMGLTGIDYEVKNVSDGTILSSVDYTLTYHTEMAGDLTDNYTITAEYQGGWVVMWEPALIFPSMEWGDRLLTGVNYPVRGEIFDADGNLLAENISPLTVYCVPANITTDEQRAELRAAILAVPELADRFSTPESLETLDRILSSRLSSARLLSVYPDMVSDDFEERILAVEGLGIDASGALVTTKYRNYPYGSSLSHILGFASIIQEEDLDAKKDVNDPAYDPFYDGDSWLGYAGLELQYENILRGEKGSFAYIQGSNGENRKTLYNIPAVNGQDIHLTVKIKLQQRVEEIVDVVSYTGTVPGVVIVMNPTTGAVEAMYSWPDYDPNDFSRGLIDDETWQEMENDTVNTPLLNRAIQGLYPPGSTFKTLTGSLGVDSGTITWDTVFPDTEYLKWDIWEPSRSGGQFSDLGIEKVTRTGNSNRHTPMNLENSIIDSDNIFFAWTALLMGWDKFISGMEAVGMTEAIPFDLPTQTSQIINEGTEKTGTLLTMTGYGQGEILTTPLQMASYIAAFRNGGVAYEPYVVDSLWLAEGTEYTKISEHESAVWKRICTEETAALMEQAMIGVCRSRYSGGGTGRYLGVTSYVIAGKTGTAEIGKAIQDDAKERELAWFIGYRYSNPDGSPLNPEDERLVLVMLELDMANLPDDEYSMLKFWIAQLLLKDDTLTEDDITQNIMG